MNTTTLGIAPDALTSAQPLPEKASVDIEIFERVRGWAPMLPGFGVRLLAADEEIRDGDFDITGIGDEGPRVIYRGRWDNGKKRESHRAQSGTIHHELTWRYTISEPLARGIFCDASVETLVEAMEAQRVALAAAERKRLGEACACYREALERGAVGAELRGYAIAADDALAAFNFEDRGGWWDARNGAWGIGPLDEDVNSEVEAGAFVSGPH